ncbi:MAG: ABC transporter permease [Candidatus Heimdallarchaeota archaeon]
MNEIVEGFWNALNLLIALDTELLTITFLSLRISSTAVLLAALIAVPAGIGAALVSFPGKNVLRSLLNTLMGFPPVVMGLFLYLLLSNQGPLGEWQLLYSPEAMIIVQFLLAFPIIMGVTLSSVESVDPTIRETAMALGASEPRAVWKVVVESQRNIVAGVILGFGRAISEVGAITIVGGNIRWQTRALTTGIVREVARGEYEFAIALGIILLSLSFLVTTGLTYLQIKECETSTILTLAIEVIVIVNLPLFENLANINSRTLLEIQLWLLLTIPIATLYVGKQIKSMSGDSRSRRIIVTTMAPILVIPWKFTLLTIILKGILFGLLLVVLLFPKLEWFTFHYRRTAGSLLLSTGILIQLYEAFFQLFVAIAIFALPVTASAFLIAVLWRYALQSMKNESQKKIMPRFSEINCKSLSKKFEEPEILNEISFSIKSGEIISILGPNGAGKTTILRILAGFLRPDEGEYEIQVCDNGSTTRLEEKKGWLRQNSTLVHQNPTIFDESVWKNLEFGLKSQNLSTMDRKARVIGALHQTGLEEFVQRDAKTLSSGEKQRLAFARGISLFPAILFIDEPTSNLDPANAKRVEDSLKILNEQGVTVVMATHNLFQARRLSDRVALLMDGKIIEAATVQEFFENPKDPRTLAFVRGDMVY